MCRVAPPYCRMAHRKKLIPQFACTYYLGVFQRVCSTTLSSQTLDVVTGEQTLFLGVLQELAPGLLVVKQQMELLFEERPFYSQEWSWGMHWLNVGLGG